MLSQTLETRLLAYSCLSVCLSVCPNVTIHPPLQIFSRNYMRIFPKSTDKIPVSLKCDAYNGTLYECLCKYKVVQI
jgi:hypothetical protein